MADDIGMWKRNVMKDAGKLRTKKNAIPNIGGVTNNEILEMGNALEEMSKTKGWLIMESWIYNETNSIKILGLKTDFERGRAAGQLLMMQRMEYMISKKNELVEEERVKKEKEAKRKAQEQKDIDK